MYISMMVGGVRVDLCVQKNKKTDFDAPPSNRSDARLRRLEVFTCCSETIVGRLRAAPDSVKNIAQQLFSEECKHLKKQSSERSLGDGVLAKELLTE
jgi:hypothetical protein